MESWDVDADHRARPIGGELDQSFLLASLFVAAGGRRERSGRCATRAWLCAEQPASYWSKGGTGRSDSVAGGL